MTGDISWNVTFEPDYAYSYTVRQPEESVLSLTAINAARVTWRSQYYLNVGYQVYLDGKLLGYTPNSFYMIKILTRRRSIQLMSAPYGMTAPLTSAIPMTQGNTMSFHNHGPSSR
ncbi:MAG: hypothetical protein R2756_14485 [Bacteroidales bacterium]